MKVIYEFNPVPGTEDCLDLQLFQNTVPMYISLLEIDSYVSEIKNKKIKCKAKEMCDYIEEIIDELGIKYL